MNFMALSWKLGLNKNNHIISHVGAVQCYVLLILKCFSSHHGCQDCLSHTK